MKGRVPARKKAVLRAARLAGIVLLGAPSCAATWAADQGAAPAGVDQGTLEAMVEDWATPVPRSPSVGDALIDFDRRKRDGVDMSVPADLAGLLSDKATSSRLKLGFIRAILPLVLHANETIMRDRSRIEVLRIYRSAGVALDAEDESWLARIAARYGVDAAKESGPFPFERLLERVDIVPPSLALAQAAEESGWGRSRFARQGNALFGQRIFRGAGGMVPVDRAEGESYRVRSFDGVGDAVRSYLRNLNTHYAYESFRRARADMRRRRGTLDGYGLTTTLSNYSERRESYLVSIRAIMRHNGLEALDLLQPESRGPNRPDT